MGYLFPILIAFTSLAYGAFELPTGEPRPWGVLVLLPLPYLLGSLDYRMPFGLSGPLRWLRRGLGALEQGFPILLQYAAVAAFGWLESIEQWFGVEVNLEGWPTPELIFALGPFVLGSLISIDSQARRAGAARTVLRILQVRMFLTALCPIIGYVLLTALVGSVEILRLGVQMVSLWSVSFTLGLVLLFAALLPYFLRVTWDTATLPPGPQRELLLRVGALANFRCRELLVWRTGHLMANAAIVGLLPGSRRVFFTDELLARMGPRQLAAVYAHEIGHAKRYHVPIFLTWAIAVFSGLDVLLTWLDPESEALALGLLGLGVLLWGLAFGWLSRRIELQADLYSLELLEDGEGIIDALRSVSGPDGSRGSWRHFCTDRRVRFLRQAMVDPAVGAALHRLVRGVAILGLLLAGLAGGGRLLEFGGDYPVERSGLDLGLGRYAQVLERLEDRDDEDAAEIVQLATFALEEGLKRQENLAAALGATRSRAQDELLAGNLNAATAWLTLASYSGDREAATAAQWLLGLEHNLEDPSPVPPGAGVWAASLKALGP